MNKPEILAPAGSFESLRAAVYCGANAVYLGAKSLNARRNAGNFDEVELRDAVEFCHERDVKVYQTLNILMYDREREELIQAVKTACSVGLDAVLVQDLGALSIIREMAPELPIYASTQMAVHNLSGAIKAAELGCRRVVLARELSIGEITHIAKNSPVPVESFVQGALCMSVSGQCYLSAMLGQRSGNRGLCAQPCRLPFSVGNATHGLSLKDLSAAEDIATLANAGVASLKIEGRMKRPEYVAAAVTAIKAAVEGREPDMDTLQKVFSRSGFTNGYLEGKVDKEMFGHRLKEDVVAAKEVLGSLALLAQREAPIVRLGAAFTARADAPMELVVTDNRGNRVVVTDEIAEVAQNKPTDPERVKQGLEKTGGTPYYFSEMDIRLDDGLIIKASQLNAMRRTAIEEIATLRRVITPHACYDAPPAIVASGKTNKTPAIRMRAKLSQVSKYAARVAESIILPLDDCKAALAYVPCEKIIAEIPRILFNGEDKVLQSLKELRKLGITRAYVQNIGAFVLAEKADMQISCGWALNVLNSDCAFELEGLNAEDIELSFEMALSDAKRIAATSKGILAYGYLPLMTFRNCPVKAQIGCARCQKDSEVIDRMGVKMRVSCESGTAEMFNSVPLYMADRMDEMRAFDFVTLWFTKEDLSLCDEVLSQYANQTGNPNVQTGHTRGLYYRGVF